MKTKLLSLALALAGSLIVSQSMATVIVDDVFDSSDGWAKTNPDGKPGGWWPNASGNAGLTPVVGTSFFVMTANPDRQYLTKTFTSANFTAEGQAIFGGSNDYKIIAGTYTVSVYVGAAEAAPFAGASRYNAYLTAGGSTVDDRIAATSSVKTPVPGAAEWQEWTFTFVIDEDTVTQGGANVIGQSLGGFVDIRSSWSSEPGLSTYIATDGFKITYTAIPEPAESAMMLGAVVLLVMGLMRYRRRR
ncbi:hypothetical protein H5P28_11960 [Ruficoccus amylovorans]|uniref:PEP-CTERM sorting domain-containing protein n=1 Tax=Ruficoccus amylovorans TaxID=1804625 RepID=A0A842HEW9_9BACT|nr:hypothetical protein [Ruficoccus amylovorans]MBC2594972.1 hypothetical protein [Ruficoccus amylovorans]